MGKTLSVVSANDLETLNTHLRTFKIYKCAICGEKILQLTNIKTHFKENDDTHKIDGPFDVVRHIKQSRENIDVYDQQYHSYLSLFPEFNLSLFPEFTKTRYQKHLLSGLNGC